MHRSLRVIQTVTSRRATTSHNAVERRVEHNVGHHVYLLVRKVGRNLQEYGPVLILSAAELNDLRRRLINELTAKRAAPPKRRVERYPAVPETKPVEGDPVTIFQVLTADQLTKELAELEPEYIYIPLEVLYKNPGCQDIFVENGSVPVAVLPRVITDDQVSEIADMLKNVYEQGVREALVGNIGHVLLARRQRWRGYDAALPGLHGVSGNRWNVGNRLHFRGCRGLRISR